MYVNGILSPAVSAKVSSREEIQQFNARSFVEQGIEHRRLKIPYSLLIAGELDNLLEEYVSVYNHYTFHMEKYVDQYYEHNEETVIELPSFQRFVSFMDMDDSYSHYFQQIIFSIGRLISECAERMPTEFDEGGNDPQWFFIGKKVFAIVDKTAPVGRIKGFRVVEEIKESQTLKLWMAYVDPLYRQQGVYNRLMALAKKYARDKNLQYISVATDTTSDNPMNEILSGLGFVKETVTFRTTNSLE